MYLILHVSFIATPIKTILPHKRPEFAGTSHKGGGGKDSDEEDSLYNQPQNAILRHLSLLQNTMEKLMLKVSPGNVGQIKILLLFYRYNSSAE
jgi:hypothetical protein